VTPDGDVILLVPGDSVAARAAAHAQDDDLSAVMKIMDVAPVAVPHRIRGRALVTGWLTHVRNKERAACSMLLAEQHLLGEIFDIGEAFHPGPAPGLFGRPAGALLRLEVAKAQIEDLWGEEVVESDDFVAASCDPLARHEAELLQHLHAAHSDQVHALSSLLGERQAYTEGEHAVPVALDRFGLRVRFGGSGRHCFDVRFEFSEPVRDVTELRRAMHALFETAARGGRGAG
jgi:hypothetical protein